MTPDEKEKAREKQDYGLSCKNTKVYWYRIKRAYMYGIQSRRYRD